MGVENADFSGWATKAGLKCSDGRVITGEAFQHQDGFTVPLVWQHDHSTPEHILGHAVLEARKGEGVYAYAFFNSSPAAQAAKALVKHGDITMMSIYANGLLEKLVNGSKQVLHGMIREVSLVLAGANAGARIENVAIQHSDGSVEELSDEIMIFVNLDLKHEAGEEGGEGEGSLEHKTWQEIYDSLDEEQRQFFHMMLLEATKAPEGSATQSATAEGDTSTENNPEGESSNNQEGTGEVMHNIFDRTGKDGVVAHSGTGGSMTGSATAERHYVAQSDVKDMLEALKRPGNTLKTVIEDYAIKHGVENLDTLFPDPKLLENQPQFDKRRTEWVAGVLSGTRKSPFSRIKTVWADITQEQARALGYIKGNLKKEEWFGLAKRTTGPTTVYKKQKLDRDDVIDITTLDFVAFMKMEMRIMLEEEIARAILVGDGRPVEDPANAGEPNPDKIADPAGNASGDGIRSILNDDELFVATKNVNIDDSNSSMVEVVDAVTEGLELYKGTGTPTFYTTRRYLTKMLLTRDADGHRIWRNKAELADEMGVDTIVDVEVMESYSDLVGIMVNLQDYNIGTDAGGEVSLFDDFDLDYNKLLWLIETRASGALVKIRSAVVFKKVAAAAALVDPITAPTFNPGTGVVTIPTQTGVTYKNGVSGATLTAGAQSALAVGATLEVLAVPASASYYFKDNVNDEWSFTRA